MFLHRCLLVVVLVLRSTSFTVGGRHSTIVGNNAMRTRTTTAAQTAETPLTTATKVQIRPTLLMTGN